jgi:hypothetical protein
MVMLAVFPVPKPKETKVASSEKLLSIKSSPGILPMVEEMEMVSVWLWSDLQIAVVVVPVLEVTEKVRPG